MALSHLEKLKSSGHISEPSAKCRVGQQTHGGPGHRLRRVGMEQGELEMRDGPPHKLAFKPQGLPLGDGRLCHKLRHAVCTRGALSMYLCRFIFNKLIN